MAINNQGYRRDLNLIETTDDEQAIDNLMGTGVSADIRYIQNNLRNISLIPFNSVDNEGFFSFSSDKILSIQSLSSDIPAASSNTRITIVLTYPYKLKPGNLVELSGIDQTGATSLNGQYTVNSVSTDLTTIRVIKNNFSYTNSSISVGTGVSFIHKPENVFSFTKDDAITVSVATTFKNTSGVAVTTLSTSETYYITQPNGINKFKLSKSPSNVGFTTITIPSNATADTPLGSGEFEFVRKDPVHKQQLINYIKPEIQDADGSFTWLDGGEINGTIDTTQGNIETAEYFSLKKYRGDKTLLSTDESIKFEGSVVLNDPNDYNNNSDNVLNVGQTGAPAPGIYIGGTRAFSSDNNPWNKVGAALETSSEEVSIGELAFLDGTDGDAMVVNGIASDISDVSGVLASSFTHKIPIKVEDNNGNQESYYLLLTSS